MSLRVTSGCYDTLRSSRFIRVPHCYSISISCTGHFISVPLDLTYLHCLQHFLYKYLFNLICQLKCSTDKALLTFKMSHVPQPVHCIVPQKGLVRIQQRGFRVLKIMHGFKKINRKWDTVFFVSISMRLANLGISSNCKIKFYHED